MLCYIFFNNTSVPTIYSKTKITDAFPEGLPYIKPKSLVTSSGLKWQYQLDPHLKDTLQEETEKHHFHFCNGENDKINRPIYLFFSGAGTGKSRNASEFHNTLIKCLNCSKDLKLKEKIQDAWVFNVSLENGISFSRSVESIGILAVGIRMFWQLFPDFEDFIHFIYTYEAPTPWENDIVVPVFQQDNHIIKLLVDDCGGHEVLAETLRDTNINDCNIDNLMHCLCSNIIHHYEDAFNITALETQTIYCMVNIDQKAIGNSVEGYFEATYIWVWIMAQQAAKNGDPLLKDWQFCDYREHSSVSDWRLPVGSQFWNHFEHFIANFHSLKSKVLCENELTTVSEIHAGARLHLNDDFKFKNHHLKLECAIHHVNTNFATYDKRMDIECEGTCVNVWEGKHCIINAQSAPYGDSFLALDQSKYNNPNEVHQAKRAHVYAIVGPLNINTATYTELMTIDGIGVSQVGTILKKRPFKTLEDAKRETGIPEKALKRLKFPEED
ncbi:9052_t:CDS:2 [Entrophospora sp. SA101]|nr:7416_t:CDS:2 [Entrophospora sp. SA101]CAJ0925618.1 9052_t:CDS:2 [Entrophospora sp. SA101]